MKPRASASRALSAFVNLTKPNILQADENLLVLSLVVLNVQEIFKDTILEEKSPQPSLRS
jgi:hypothetical protein